MPQFVGPDGKVHVVPGFYGVINAVLNTPGTAPEFFVPLVLADGYSGFPSSWIHDSRRFNDEIARLPFVLCRDTSRAQQVYGAGCDMSLAFEVAKRHGLPEAYTIAANKLTRSTIVVTSTGPVNQFTIGGYYWGFPAGWTKLRFASSIFAYQVPLKMAKITAAVTSGDTRLFVDDNSWMVPGQSLELGDNDSANEVVVVKAIGRLTNSNGTYSPYIDLTSGTTGAFATTDYAAIALYGSTVVKSPTFSSGQGRDLIDWINANASGVIRAQAVSGTFTGALPITLSSLTPMKDISAWGAKTTGTSPSTSASDIQDFLTDMNDQLLEDFTQAVGQPPRAWLVGTSDGTAQGYLRDYAQAQRNLANGSYVSITCGCAWGDIDLSASNSTNPIYRARQLNSQDVCLVACGADGRGSNLTLAPAVFGRRVGNRIPHNLTKDVLQGFSTFEVRWKEITAGQLTALLRGGVVTYMQVPLGGNVQPVISQGLSTLQSNAVPWTTNQTCFIQYRDNADYVELILKVLFVDTIIGEVVDADFIRASVIARAQRLLLAKGFITSFRLISVERNAEGNGYDFSWEVQLPGVTDYIGATTNILVE